MHASAPSSSAFRVGLSCEGPGIQARRCRTSVDRKPTCFEHTGTLQFEKQFLRGEGFENLTVVASRRISEKTRFSRLPATRSESSTQFSPGRQWWQSGHRSSSQNGAGTEQITQQPWTHRQGKSLVKKSAWIAALVLMGGGALYGQAKTQAYVESKFLPPIAATVGRYFGREIELGRVQSISPFGLTLGPCSVGPNKEEFSCGELPGVEIRILPLASLQRGQLVVDVVLAQPHVLVSQKEDWTWLGIPLTASEEKKPVRHSSEANIDLRTKVRRVYRETAVSRFLKERQKAAGDAARNGYKISCRENTRFKREREESRGFESTIDAQVEKENSESIGHSEESAQADIDGSFVEEELGSGFEAKSSVMLTKTWLDTHMVRPVTGRLLRGWMQRKSHPATKACLQLKNLDRSAAAACAYFEMVAGKIEEEGRIAFAKTHTCLESDITSPMNATPMKPQSEGYLPVSLNSVHFRDGTLMLLGYGDCEPRVMENVSGSVQFRGSAYEEINAQVSGNPKEWRTGNMLGDGGKLFLKIAVDLAKQKWDIKLKAQNIFAPLFERLLEIPLDWSNGRASGEMHIWMMKEDHFPNFGGRLDVKGLEFCIWDAPSAFKGVSGTLFFQGQRLFFHNTSGAYGAIPLRVSGDIDLNPEDGEYRLSSQISSVEVNALMKSLNARPPPFPLAGALKGVVHCRGPLDAPIFEGSAEVSGKHVSMAFATAPSVATDAITKNVNKGAIAAYDRIPFVGASASFTFNMDNCIADLYGIRASPSGGGEIRGAGNMWICPEGELDLTAVSIDCSGQVATDTIIKYYIPANMDLPSSSFGPMHGEAKIRGSILSPVFDVKWDMPEAQGSFKGAHGDIHISREAISLNSSAFTFDLSTKVHTLYPPFPSHSEHNLFEFKPPSLPTLEGLDLDLRLRGFDVMGMAPMSSPIPHSSQMKVTGKVKFNGRVPNNDASLENDTESITHNGDLEPNLTSVRKSKIVPQTTQKPEILGLIGEVSLSGVKVNQLLVAPYLSGSLDLSPTSFKLNATGRPDEHLQVHVSKDLHSSGRESFSNDPRAGASFSLLRGQLRTDIHYQPGFSAKLEIRNLQLDELELASLRGAVQKAEVTLNFQKRRGQGTLSVRRPRCSGVQGESLDLAARWSGDVVTLDKSVLEQANSRYELQGEYVLPGLRDRTKGKEVDGIGEKAMAGHLRDIITSMGRWRLRLDVPRAEVSEMLPVARLLSRSSDPAVLSRSKVLFLQAVQKAGFCADNLKQQLEYARTSRVLAIPEEGSAEAIPLPGLAELRGAWHGTLEASGGGNGDTNILICVEKIGNGEHIKLKELLQLGTTATMMAYALRKFLYKRILQHFMQMEHYWG